MEPYGEFSRLMPPMVPQYTLPPERPEYDSRGNVIPSEAQKSIAHDNSNAQGDPGDYIRRLIIETNAAVRPMDQREVSGAKEDRLLGIRPKLPNQDLADRRRTYFLDNMLKTYGRPTATEEVRRYTDIDAPPGKTIWTRPKEWDSLSPEMADAMFAHATDDPQNVRGRYENTGWIGPGSTLGTAGTWIMAVPAAAYGVSEGLANLAGSKVKSNEQVFNDISRAAGTFAHPITRAVGAERLPGTSHFDDMALARERMDNADSFDRDRTWWQMLDPSLDNAMKQAEESQKGSVDGGEELLNRYGVDQLIGRLGTRGLGGVMDATTNVFFGGPDIIRAAQAGKALKSLGLLGLEYGPDAGLAGARTYLENKQ